VTISKNSRPPIGAQRERDSPQNYIFPDIDIICMPTKTVVERKKATPKAAPKKALTPAEQAERQASIDRLDADIRKSKMGKSYTLAEIKKEFGL